MNTQKKNFYFNKTKVYRYGLVVLTTLFLYPIAVKQNKTVVFTKQLHINTSKQEPPRIAFNLMSVDPQKASYSETGKILLIEDLNQGLKKNSSVTKTENIFAKKIFLPKMVVDKSALLESLDTGIQNTVFDDSRQAAVLKAEMAKQGTDLNADDLRQVLNQRQQFMLQQASQNPQLKTILN